MNIHKRSGLWGEQGLGLITLINIRGIISAPSFKPSIKIVNTKYFSVPELLLLDILCSWCFCKLTVQCFVLLNLSGLVVSQWTNIFSPQSLLQLLNIVTSHLLPCPISPGAQLPLVLSPSERSGLSLVQLSWTIPPSSSLICSLFQHPLLFFHRSYSNV